MRLLGIDPGLVKTGWAVIKIEENRNVLVSWGVLSPPRSLSVEKRIFFLYEGIREVVKKQEVEEASMEDVFFSPSMPTILPMAQARGAIMVAVMAQGCPLNSYSANQVKKSITGSGHASKEQVARMAKLLVGENESKFSEHVSDAIAIALCHSIFRG